MYKRIVPIALILLAVLIGGVSLPTRAANGGLDRTFGGYGTGGRILSDPFPGTSIIAAVAMPDDKVVAVGSNGQDFVIARYDASGKLDSTFGTHGITTVDFDNHIDSASAVAIAYDSTSAMKIVVVGTTRITISSTDFAVARLNADGTPDNAFSQDGKVTVDFNGGRDAATAVMFEGGSTNVLVAGSVEAAAPPGGFCAPACRSDFGFVELTESGSPNGFFNNTGKAETGFGTDAVPQALTYNSSGFYAVGYRTAGAGSEYLIAAYTGGGAPNNSFNGTGYRTGSAPSRLTAVVRLHDNTTLAAGDAGGDFGLLRFKDDGSPVAGWGTNGLATVDFGADDSPHMLFPLYLFNDGPIMVAGSSGARLAMARLNEQGQVVPNSASTTDLSDVGAGSVRALAMSMVPDVRLRTIGSIKAGSSARLVLLRHFLDGSADDGGRQTTDFVGPDSNPGSKNDRAKAAVFQPDGKLLVAGSSFPSSGDGAGAAIVRYTAAGALDPLFDADGRQTLTALAQGAADIALQPDGKIVVAGADFSVARLKPDGSLDMSFNGTGYAQPNIGGGAESMVIQPDGKIVLAGGNGATFVLVRFTSAGALDPTFGLDGIVHAGIGLISGASDVAIQPDGKLIAAGGTVVSQLDYNFALMRFNSIDGSLDTSFDGDGKLTTDFGSVDQAYTVAIQPDGAILAAGTTLNNGAAFARYRPGGSLDPTFDGDGKQTVQLTGGDVARALVVSPTGITAALCDQSDKAGLVVRLTPGGTLDSSFSGNGHQLFRFGGTDCPYGLASEPGRIAAVGYARNTPPTTGLDYLTEDFAVAMFDNAVAPPPSPTPTPSPTPSPTNRRIYMPMVRR